MSAPSLPSRTSPIWIAIGTIGAAGLSFLFQGLLSVTLSDAEFGLMSSSIILALAFSVFATMGAQDVTLHLVKARKLSPEIALSAYTKVWALHGLPPIGISVLAFVLYRDAASVFFFISTFSALASFFVLQTAERQSRDDFRGVGMLLLALEFCKLTAAMLAASVGGQLNTSYLVFGCVFLLLILVRVAQSSFRWKREETIPYKEIIALGMPYAVAAFMFMAYYRITIVVLSSFGLQDEAGSLSVIYLFLGAFLLLPTSFSQKFLQGRWHSISAPDVGAYKAELKRQYRILFLFVTPVCIMWFFLSEPILAMIYPGRYQMAADHARWFAAVFVLRCVCIPLQGAASVAALRWWKLVAVLVAALATFTTSLTLTPVIGFMSGFAAALIGEAAFVMGLSVVLWRAWRNSQDKETSSSAV